MSHGWILALGASLLLTTACAQPVDEEVDDSAGALRGTPGAAYDDAAKQGDVAMRRAVLAAYRNASSSRLYEQNWGRCATDRTGTRSFVLKVAVDGTSSRQERAAFADLYTALSRADFNESLVLIKQNPTKDPARWDLAFYGIKDGDARCDAPSTLLACSGVSADEGPTEAECGLAAR